MEIKGVGKIKNRKKKHKAECASSSMGTFCNFFKIFAGNMQGKPC